MRNLKRALSLALAAAMLIGMMVVGASAAEYKDADSINNAEAVEVLTGIGVVGGSNGSYNPDKTLTRAEFCVMIANALTGGKFDKTLFEGTDTPFTDINGHWGAAYIAYCYTAGVIAGTSATTFSPDGNLTAAQAEAILLSALGYNKNGEFAVNGQFSLNVTNWATQAGLLDGVSVSANAGITRDNMAQILFNALVNTTPVGYSKLGETYYTAGTNALNGQVFKGDDLNAFVAGGNYAKTLGYTNFKLVKAVAAEDYSRPSAYTWTVNGKSIADTYVDAPMATYTAGLKYNALYNLLGKAVVDGLDTANLITDGATTGITIGNITKTNTADLVAGKGGLIEVYYDEGTAATTDETLTVVVINTYLAQVTSVTDATATTDRKVGLTMKSTGVGFADANYTTDDYAMNDYVLVTGTVAAGNLTIKDVKAATVVEGVSVTAVKGTENFVANGVTYNYSVKNDGVYPAVATTKNLVLDSYGYVLATPAYNEKLDLSSYLVVTGVTTSGIAPYNVVKANVVFADGTVAKEVTVDKVDNATAAADTNVVDNRVYSYTVKDGVYTLKTVAAPYNKNTVAANDVYTTGAATITLNSVNYTVNSETVFVVMNTTNNKIAVYTGAKNAPTFTANAGTVGAVLYKTTGNVAGLIYIEIPGANITGTTTAAKDLVYILDATPTQSKSGNDTIYTYSAIVNGVIGTIATKNTFSLFTAVGLYAVTDYDGDYANTVAAATTTTDIGGITNVDTMVGTNISGVNLSYGNDVLKIGTGAYACADDVAVYLIAKNKTATVASTAALTINSIANCDITLVLDGKAATQYVTAVYIQYK